MVLQSLSDCLNLPTENGVTPIHAVPMHNRSAGALVLGRVQTG